MDHPEDRLLPFFDRSRTRELIEEIANASRITIFAGAGVSSDRGSPDWSELVSTLLRDRIRKSPQFQREIEAAGTAADELSRRITRALIAAQGLDGAASLVRTILDKDEHDPLGVLQDIVHDVLYHEWAPGGPLATTIAELAATMKAAGRDVAVITTNYDDNVESAFLEAPLLNQLTRERGISVRPYVSDRAVDETTLPVYHIHGLVPRRAARRGRLVLSEEDFARVGVDSSGWPSNIVLRRLRESTVLFVGTSLRDWNLLRWLVETVGRPGIRKGGGRYVTSPVQGDPWRPSSTQERELFEAVAWQRLRPLGLEAIRTDFFGQVSQFLHEISLCASLGPGSYSGDDATERYGQRLMRWYEEWTSAVEELGHDVVQDSCQRHLHEAKVEVMRLLEPARNELFKIELWVRDPLPDNRELVLWSTSEAAWRHARTLHRGRLENDSQYVSVRAFCLGYVYRPVERVSAGRWQTFVGTPLVLGDPPWLQLPVGVITIASTGEGKNSALRRIGNARVAKIVEKLHACGTELVDPQGLRRRCAGRP